MNCSLNKSNLARMIRTKRQSPPFIRSSGRANLQVEENIVHKRCMQWQKTRKGGYVVITPEGAVLR
jgi:hypothetical protein